MTFTHLHDKANRRHFIRHPLQLVLAILGVALGVALVVSIDLAAQSTHRAFSLSMQALTGRYTHHIQGGPSGLPETLFTKLRIEAGINASAPAIEGDVNFGESTLRLIGFDIFSEQNFKNRFNNATEGQQGTQLLTEPNTVLLSKVSASRLRLTPGDLLDVRIANRAYTLRMVGYAEGDAAPDPALEGLILADMATAQEVLERVGRLDRIDIVLADDQEAESRIRAILPDGAELVSANGRHSATQNMTAAFELNLRAMSLLALLVGSFLIYNTMAFSVLQRRELLASLRVLGATRSQLLREILCEAAILGFIGGLLGVGLGLLAARALLLMVTKTINDLYFVLTVTEFFIDPWALGLGLVLGVTVAVLAALGPALEASWTSPILARARSGVEDKTRHLLPWMAGIGIVTLVIACLLLRLSSEALLPAMVGIFLLLLGYGFLCPLLLLGSVHLAARLASCVGSVFIRLAIRGIAATLSRSGLAIAALTMAVAVSIGVGTMIESFRGSITEWLEQILQADIYIAMPQSSPRYSTPLPDHLTEMLASIQGVDQLGTGRRIFVSTAVGESEVLALDPPYPDRPGFRFKHTDGHALWARFSLLQGLFISEPFAQRHRLAVGDTITVMTDQGRVNLPIEAIFFDYRSDQGLIVMHRKLYDKLWNDRKITSLGIYLKPDTAIETVRAELEKRLAIQQQPFQIRSNLDIRDASLETFDRTFAITQVLRILAFAVALIGIISALMALQYERRKEMAILRASGLTPWQTGQLVFIQTGFMGLMAGIMAIPLGLAVALALVRVINLRSFGWTMEMMISAPPLFLAVLLAMIAALLAGIYPAYLAMKTAPAQGLREE